MRTAHNTNEKKMKNIMANIMKNNETANKQTFIAVDLNKFKGQLLYRLWRLGGSTVENYDELFIMSLLILSRSINHMI